MSQTSETIIANALIDAGINEKISVQEAETFLALLAGEPVAWRCKDYADGWILDANEKSAREYQRQTGCLMQPLYASPAPLPVAVKVKPLEWKNRTAKTDAGVMYAISGHRKLGERGFILRIVSGLGTENHNIDDFDEAKAAAQTDFETRIRSALSSPAQSGYCTDCENQTTIVNGKCSCGSGRVVSSPVGGTEETVTDALRRISELTPARANARTANDLHLTVKAIADTALAGISPTPASDIAALREENERLLEALKTQTALMESLLPPNQRG